MTNDVVEVIYDLQQQDYATLYIDTLQRILAGIIRNDMGSEEDRLNLAGEVLGLQDILRRFIQEEKGGEA
ncbi:hypothetical protein [uncultured Bacteroides sp.]|uniref:hypothetical protein n=1 Tax=uncultured Bacteroides sp. TaxID=162156 RepID=UPI00260A44CA|nr:hypothetical protein [uncultured Bacteroides sp.]